MSTRDHLGVGDLPAGPSREATAEATAHARAALGGVAHAASEGVAQMAGALVRVLPEVAFTFRGAGAPGWNVARFTAEEALSSLYEVRVDLAHEAPHADPEELLGQPAVLTLRRGEHARHFAGVVRRVEHLGVAGGHRLARAHVVPELWALSQRVDSRVFQQKTAVEVALEVLAAAGVYAGRVERRLRGRPLPREYCVQYRESDLDFVRRLLEEEGVTFHFAHGPARETLVLTDHVDAWERAATLDGAPVPIAGAGAQVLHAESIRHFDTGSELRATSATVRDFDFTRPRLDLTRAHTSDDNDARPAYEHGAPLVLAGYEGVAYARDNRAEQAQLRDEAEAALRQRASGRGGVIAFAPGAVFALEGHGEDARNARHLVTRVKHRGRAPEAELGETQHHDGGDERYANEFECMPAGTPHRPARATPRPAVAGFLTATVVGPQGEEIWVDEHGRVKVRFHWDRLGRRDDTASCWVRVMQPWAGSGWGFVFTPRVDMEVVVQFEGGDPDRPMVVGCAYNGENRPPYPLPAERTKSTVKTRSSPRGDGFNELRFEDLKDREQVYLHAQRNHDVTVRKDQTITVGGNRTKSVTGMESNTVQRDRTSTVAWNDTLTVNRNYTVTVHGDTGMTATVDNTLQLTSRKRIQLAVGSSTITLTPDGVWIQGAVVRINCNDTPPDEGAGE